MTPAHYRCWLIPAHRVLSQAILAAYRRPCTKRTHLRREPKQAVLL